MPSQSLYSAAFDCLMATLPEVKVRATQTCAQAWRGGELRRSATEPARAVLEPGRPARPRLVRPRDLAKRKLASLEGRAALIHALCHIEFNAINLAWDAVYRFRDLPDAYYGDWIRVAEEEAYHFVLLRDHLCSLGFEYGDFDAHNGLWEMALETAHDPLVRMALVPRVLEARGLDVTPGISAKLAAVGDERAVAILEIIHRDEVGHVATGSRWFHYLCAQRDMEPEATFRRLLSQYMRGRLKGPYHRQARLAAGFSSDELYYLEQLG